MSASRKLSPLQKAYQKCLESSRTNASASSRFYKELECRVVYISDGEVSEEDAPLLAKFLSCKQAHNDIRAIRLVRTETIVEIKPKKSTKASLEPPKKHSALSFDNARLFKAVADCISKCINLESIVIVGVELPREVFEQFGRALIRCKSEKLHTLTIRNMALNDDGLRALTPYLAKSRFRTLFFEKCGLTDTSCDYLVSIVKSQEAMMDTMYWNSTLRLDARFGDQFHEAEARLSGMQALSVAGNKITSSGILRLAKFLRRNQWLLAVNFANNRIDHDGIAHLSTALHSNTTLHTIVLAGNPGYTTKLGQTLDEAAIAAHAKMAKQSSIENTKDVPIDVLNVVKQWINTKVQNDIDHEKAEALKAPRRGGSPILGRRKAVQIESEKSVGQKSNAEFSPKTLSGAIVEKSTCDFRSIGGEELDLGSQDRFNYDSIVASASYKEAQKSLLMKAGYLYDGDDVDDINWSRGSPNLFHDDGFDSLQMSERMTLIDLAENEMTSLNMDPFEYTVPDPDRVDIKSSPPGARPASRISMRPRPAPAAVPPPARSTSPKTLPAAVSRSDEYSDTLPAFVFNEKFGRSSERTKSANGSPSITESSGRPASARGMRASTGTLLLSAGNGRTSSAPLRQSQGSMQTSSFLSKGQKKAAEIMRKPTKQLTRSLSAGGQMTHMINDRSTSTVVYVPSIMGRHANAAKNKSSKSQNASSPSLKEPRMTRMRARSKVPKDVKIADIPSASVPPKTVLQNSVVAKSVERKSPVSRLVQKTVMSNKRASSSPNLKKPIDKAPVVLASPSSAKKPVMSASPSTTKKSPESQKCDTGSSKKSSKKSPKSPLENFEDNVVKRLNKAVTHVTSNLQAVSRQLMIANDSLVETIGVTSAPSDVQEFRSSPKKVSPEKFVSSRHSSPNNYELQYATELSEIEEELKARILSMHYGPNGDLLDSAYQTTTISASQFDGGSNSYYPESNLENVHSDEESFGRRPHDSYGIDEYSDVSEIPQSILNMVEDSLKEKLRATICSKGELFL